jgi:predicted dehydrogenase
VADVRLGLIGCGRLAERGYIPALRRARGIRLSAVADPVRERCADVAPGVPAFAGAADMLDARAADVLVLATPAHAHLRDARLAAAAGVPTLVEKPPAPTVLETEELAALEPIPFVGFNRRFEPALRDLRAAARAASALELRLVLRRRPGSWPSHESTDPVALDLGPHLVDLAFWLTGADAEHVSGQADEENLTMEIALAGGRGHAHVECGPGRRYRERVEIRGVGSFARGGLRSTFRESPLVASLALQLEAFARGDPEVPTAADGLRVMRALECVTS